MSEAEQKVKAHYPGMYVYCSGQFDPNTPPHYITGYAIISALYPGKRLGYGKTEQEAWQDAAQRIEVSNAK